MLANVVGKSNRAALSPNLKVRIDPDSFQGSGRREISLRRERRPDVRLAARKSRCRSPFNPSHLEAVNPVVEGLVRPKQDRLSGEERARVIPILIRQGCRDGRPGNRRRSV